MEMVKEAIEGWLEVASEQQSPSEKQKLVSHSQLPIKADTYGKLR
jgi:predicted RNase H-like HicB family nuclease